MKSFAVRVEGEKILSLEEACKKEFPGHDYISKSQRTRILFIFRWSYFRGSSSALIAFDFEDSNSCRVDVAVEGYRGGDAIEGYMLNKIENFIKRYSNENHLKLESVETNFNSTFVPAPTPESFLKKCVRCGKKIPIASEACEYCGARQPSRR